MRASLYGLDDPTFYVGTGHHIWDSMAIELEMAELLYGLVRYRKPEVIIECGTGSGRSTRAIATALLHNRRGVVYSFEPQEEFYEAARKRFEDNEQVEIFRGRAHENTELVPDMVFVDTGGGKEYRDPEIAHWLRHPSLPLVVVHDGTRPYESFSLGDGVIIHGHDGVWIGRGRS